MSGIPSVIKSAAFSPDGTRIVTGGENNSAKVWDARTGAIVLELKGHTTPVVGVAFSPDGTRIVTGGDGQPRTVSANRTLSDPSPGEVKVWDARTGKALFDLKGHSGSVASVAYSPDGKRIVTGGGDFGWPGELKVWDAEKGGNALFERNGIAGDTTTVSYSPDGKWIVTGGKDGTTTVVNATTGAVEFKLEGRVREVDQTHIHMVSIGTGVLSAAFSPDGTRIATGGGDRGKPGEAYVWDARAGREFPDEEELTYRRLQMGPNFGRYREGYRAARAAKDDFAARFYLNLVPPADRAALEAKADLEALVPLSQLAAEHMRTGKSDQALPLLVEIANVKKARLGPGIPTRSES